MSMSFIDQIIDDILVAEGGYVNDSSDLGGATRYGITETVAKQNGYYGDMKQLPESLARQIYKAQYYLAPKFDKVAVLSPDVAAELTDCGVNCGVNFAKTSLQSALNLLNRDGKDYADLKEDGDIGPATLAALGSFLTKRDEDLLLKLLCILRGARYVEICKARSQNENFLAGWLSRVHLKTLGD